MTNPGEPTAQDLQDMRDTIEGNVDFEVSDEMLRAVWGANPSLVWLAKQWTWSDTEARDELCAALEKLYAAPFLAMVDEIRKERGQTSKPPLIILMTDETAVLWKDLER